MFESSFKLILLGIVSTTQKISQYLRIQLNSESSQYSWVTLAMNFLYFKFVVFSFKKLPTFLSILDSRVLFTLIFEIVGAIT